MKLIRLSLASDPRKLHQSDAVVMFAYSGKTPQLDTSTQRLLRPKEHANVTRFLRARSFRAQVKEYVYVPGREKNLFIIAGLGEKGKITAEVLRRVAGRSQSILSTLSVKTLTILIPEDIKIGEETILRSLSEGIELGHYVFDTYQKPKNVVLTQVTFGVPRSSSSLEHVLQEVRQISECVYLARDLQNKKSDDIYPESFARIATEVGKTYGIKTTVLDEKKIKGLGMNLLYRVGKGSATPPRLVMMEYRGNVKDRKIDTAIVGKGITFDTGGINLKPSDPRGMIHIMHLDMSGAGVVLATMKACAMLKLPVNIIGVMPLAENAIGKNAYKPGSILRAYNGITVEVENTDAEGRLVLADAISYTIRQYQPSRVIDIATLTGLCLYFFGFHVAALLSNRENFAKQLFEAGERTSERLWQLPLYDDYRNDVKGKSADLSNTGAQFGGTITAAAFLERFVGNTPWAHIDISGTSMNGEEHDYWPMGGTGFGVRLLVDYFKRLNS